MSKTFYTTKTVDGKEVIDRVQIVREGEKPLPENKNWKEWQGSTAPSGDTPLDRYDNGKYLNDEDYYIKKLGQKDLRGDWYDKKTREKKTIKSFTETIDEDKFTKEEPIENEPYQKFDEKKDKWVVDTGKKEEAEKQAEINAKQVEIEAAEKAILRSVIAKLSDTATEEDEQFFQQYATKIVTLRGEKQQLLSA